MPRPLTVWSWTFGISIPFTNVARQYVEIPRIDPKPYPQSGVVRVVTLAELPSEVGFFDWLPTYPSVVRIDYGATPSGEEV